MTECHPHDSWPNNYSSATERDAQHGFCTAVNAITAGSFETIDAWIAFWNPRINPVEVMTISWPVAWWGVDGCES